MCPTDAGGNVALRHDELPQPSRVISIAARSKAYVNYYYCKLQMGRKVQRFGMSPTVGSLWPNKLFARL